MARLPVVGPDLSAPLRLLPPVAFAVAYGSAVFPQPGAPVGATPPMVDYLLAVDDPVEWHRANLAANRGHYSGLLAMFGAPAVVAAADRLGCGVHFNPLVAVGAGRRIKYGVLATATLVRDLTTWDALYVAGRMHKPVLVLVDAPPSVAAASSANLVSALAAARLLLPATFGEASLHAALVGLSYGGDVRMGVAEDPRKVGRIALGSRPELRAMYDAPLRDANDATELTTAAAAATMVDGPPRLWTQDISPAATARRVASLPMAALASLGHRVGLSGAPPASASPAAAASAWASAVARAVARRGAPTAAGHVKSALAGLVRASSRRQAVAALAAAGISQGWTYLRAKLSKAWGGG